MVSPTAEGARSFGNVGANTERVNNASREKKSEIEEGKNRKGGDKVPDGEGEGKV